MRAFRLWVPGEHDRAIQQASMLPHELNEPLGTPRHAPTKDGASVCPLAKKFDERHELVWTPNLPAALSPLHVGNPAGTRARGRHLIKPTTGWHDEEDGCFCKICAGRGRNNDTCMGAELEDSRFEMWLGHGS